MVDTAKAQPPAAACSVEDPDYLLGKVPLAHPNARSITDGVTRGGGGKASSNHAVSPPAAHGRDRPRWSREQIQLRAQRYAQGACPDILHPDSCLGRSVRDGGPG